jgi:hypothetical protein
LVVASSPKPIELIPLLRSLVCPPVHELSQFSNLKLSLETLEHLFFDVSDVSKLAPTSYVRVFRRPLNIYDKLFHHPGIFAADAVCKGPQFVSAGFWSLNP